jgi:uncharacterized membrane protein YdjX (TVP38/TMEM64 family)
MLGALPCYYAGRWVGEARMRAFAARHGAWMRMRSAKRSTGSRSTAGWRCCWHASCRPCVP